MVARLHLVCRSRPGRENNHVLLEANLIYSLLAMFLAGLIASIAISVFVFFKLEKLKGSNKELHHFLYKLDSTLHISNKQIQDSIKMIGQGTNGAIEKFIEVLNLTDNISDELKEIREDLNSKSGNNDSREKIEKILENSKFQTQHIHEIISRLQFEDITRQINSHLSELLDSVTQELKKQNNLNYPNDPKVEEEIRKKLAEDVIRLSTMQSERIIAESLNSKNDDTTKKNDKPEDVTFF